MGGRMAKQEPAQTGKVLAGAGIAAAAAALVAGAYFLYGRKDSAARRNRIKGWVLKMKGEVLEQIEHLKELNEQVYYQIVDTVAKQYARVKDIDAEEVAKVVAELKRHWVDIQKQLAKRPAAGSKSAPRKRARQPRQTAS